MRQPEPKARWYPRLLAGRLCLDFTNSIEARLSDQPQDSIGDYAALVAWSHHAGALNDATATALVLASTDQPDHAAASFAEAIALRETLYRTFLAIARHAEPTHNDLDAIRETYREALGHARLVALADGYAWAWEDTDGALACPLWPVARSAIELLTAPEVARVKECDNQGCGWLFLDTSKNGRRRWCSMEGCGSQVKMRRYYARRRAAATVE